MEFSKVNASQEHFNSDTNVSCRNETKQALSPREIAKML